METRYEFGMKMLNKVDGHVGEEVVAPLGDLGKILVEVFGDIYGREALSLREGKLRRLRCVTVLGREKQLKVHIHAGLNVGLTPRELRRS